MVLYATRRDAELKPDLYKKLWNPPFEGAYIIIDSKKYYLIDKEILGMYDEVYPNYERTYKGGHGEGVIYRYAYHKDYNQILKLMSDVFGFNFKYEWYEEYISDSRNRILVAEINQKIVGCFCLETQWNAFAGKTIFFARYICVDEEYRKTGIFKELFFIVKTLAKQENILSIELTSANHRKDTHQCYLHSGFTIKKTTVFIHEIDYNDHNN